MIEEDETEESSSAGQPVSEKNDTMAETNKASEAKSPVDGAKKIAETPTKLSDLPADVRTRLQRFENLQAKYKGRTMVGVGCMTLIDTTRPFALLQGCTCESYLN